jgi:hypothetical protein
LKPHRAIAAFFCALSLSACASTNARLADAPTATQLASDADHSQDAQSAIRDILAKQSPTAKPDPVAAFYRAREFQPAWIGVPERQDGAHEARALLARAGEQGLHAEDYALDSDCDAPGSAQCDIARPRSAKQHL